MIPQKLRRFSKLLIAVGGISLALYASALGYLRYQSHRTARFLNRLDGIRLDEPESKVRGLIDSHEDPSFRRREGIVDYCVLRSDPWRVYRGLGWIWFTNRWFKFLESSGLFRRGSGLRVWEADGAIGIKEHRVVFVKKSLVVEGKNEWLMVTCSLAPKISERDLEHHSPISSEMSRYFAHWAHLHMAMDTGEALVNLITPEADQDQFRAAHEINFRCLTSRRGCKSLCELMPAATAYRHQHNYPLLGWNSGSWGSQDDSCK